MDSDVNLYDLQPGTEAKERRNFAVEDEQQKDGWVPQMQQWHLKVEKEVVE